MAMPPGPHKLTDEVRLKLEEAAAIDATIEEMAFYANISKQSIYNWMEADPALKERLDALRQRPMMKARQTIVTSLCTTSGAQWYAERKAKKEFAPRKDFDITPGDKPISILTGLKDEVPNDNSTP